jgi:hypothetical protein
MGQKPGILNAEISLHDMIRAPSSRVESKALFAQPERANFTEVS